MDYLDHNINLSMDIMMEPFLIVTSRGYLKYRRKKTIHLLLLFFIGVVERKAYKTDYRDRCLSMSSSQTQLVYHLLGLIPRCDYMMLISVIERILDRSTRAKPFTSPVSTWNLVLRRAIRKPKYTMPKCYYQLNIHFTSSPQIVTVE